MTALGDAWQRALAAEHQAVYGYALLGPRLIVRTEAVQARSCEDEHRALRDRTATAMIAAGLTPVPPSADYPALYPVPDAAAAQRLAVRLEQDATVAWRYLYAVAAGAADPLAAASDPLAGTSRTAAQAALTSSAIRATRWRVAAGAAVPTVAFPGI
jgi:hypothetical protein